MRITKPIFPHRHSLCRLRNSRNNGYAFENLREPNFIRLNKQTYFIQIPQRKMSKTTYKNPLDNPIERNLSLVKQNMRFTITTQPCPIETNLNPELAKPTSNIHQKQSQTSNSIHIYPINPDKKLGELQNQTKIWKQQEIMSLF